MSLPPPSRPSAPPLYTHIIFAFAAACLIIHLAGMARLLFDVVVGGVTENLFTKDLILGLVFVFGFGLGNISQRRFQHPAFPLFMRVFAWFYLSLFTLSYLGITLRTAAFEYTLALYGAFWLILISELVTILMLLLVVPPKTVGFFALPVLAIVLFHLAAIVYLYVFASVPVSLYLLGDLALLLLMTVVGSGMLGENAFRSVLERLIEKVG